MSVTVRAATPADAATIQAQRDQIFLDMGSVPERVQAVSAASLAWTRAALERDEYLGVLAEAGGRVVAGAGVIWQSLPPSPKSNSVMRAYLLNVYVDPGHRGQRLAGNLVGRLLDECRAREVTYISLHASEMGRPTYERLGFKGDAHEMALSLPAVEAP